MPAIAVTDVDFDANVLQSNKLVLVDFWAQWCAPCKVLAPLLDEIADEMSSNVVIAKIDIEESPETAENYRVRAVPSLMLFRGGEMIASSTGAQPKGQLKQWLQENIEGDV